MVQIINAVREAVHEADPSLEEVWKWGPGFAKDGKLIISLWGFKKHVSLLLHRGSELKDKHKLINDGFDNAHNRMVKFTEMKQFNKKKVVDLVKEVSKLSMQVEKKQAKSEMKIPAELTKFFSTNKAAGKFFSELPHSFQREYVQYITKVKMKATREDHVKKVCAALKAKKKSLA
jgi:uncharacterized protein YdeI (YjbR/CyaY-like superfamily)